MLGAGAAELRLYPPSDGPLTGSLTLSAEPVTPIGEGLGTPVSVAPANRRYSPSALPTRRQSASGCGRIPTARR